jgi:magnesium transporter
MWDLYKSRVPWLLFLMLSATFSSLVIRSYESALAAVTVLTAYIPMLTDTGGNAGSQSTSTIIRGLAVGDIAPHDLPRILWREMRVALMCGCTLAVCNFIKLLVFDRVGVLVAFSVCLTLIFTVLLSQIIGGLLPVAAEKVGIDPAVMASPLITTIVDTTTLLIYFNIARIVLHL